MSPATSKLNTRTARSPKISCNKAGSPTTGIASFFGERGILLGAVHGIAESLYARYVGNGMGKDEPAAAAED